MALGYATAERNRQADTLSDQLDGGMIKIYTGTRPADANTGLSGNTLLGTIPLANPSAPAASGGVATYTMPQEDSSADNSGTATWFRALKSDGTTTVFDGSVSATGGGGDMQLVSTTITAGQPIRATSMTWTAPAA